MNKNAVFLNFCAIFILCACQPKNDPPLLGYVEIEQTFIASPQNGRLVQLDVHRGDHVQKGAFLFELDTEIEQAALTEIKARQTQSKEQARDLTTGKRSEELDVLQAKIASATSALQLAKQNLQRQESLAKQGFISDAHLDSLRAQVHTTNAQLTEARANWRVAQLAARQAQQEAALASVQAVNAQFQQAQILLDRKKSIAPIEAYVEDTYFKVGEWVLAGTPVLSLSPPNNQKLRFFIPENKLTQFSIGKSVRFSCDGCKDSYKAKINWIASKAEFTPPVIYSKENRSQLVFRAEAIPEQKPSQLPAGLPVDIDLLNESLP